MTQQDVDGHSLSNIPVFLSFSFLTKLWGASPWAALVFLIISLSGSFLLPTGNVLLVILWMVVAFVGGSCYFKYIPDTYDISNEERPYWVQDVGHITVSCHSYLSSCIHRP